MKYITSYEASKIKDSAIERNRCMVARVDALKTLTGGVDALFYKNGRSKLGGKKIALGGGVYAERNQYSNYVDLYQYGYWAAVAEAVCDDKQAIIESANKALIDAIDRAGQSALDVASIDARIEALDVLAETLVKSCKQQKLSCDEREIIFRLIKYKI